MKHVTITEILNSTRHAVSDGEENKKVGKCLIHNAVTFLRFKSQNPTVTSGQSSTKAKFEDLAQCA